MRLSFKPSEVAERYRIDTDKVFAWIRTGELPAINIAQSRGGRPRWRITPEALAAFEAARAAQPVIRQTRRRRRQPEAAGNWV
jgi:hypothetical protein